MMNFSDLLHPTSWSWIKSKTTWPALDLHCYGRSLHLVGSMHLGLSSMTPLPHGLIIKLRDCDALIVEADITQVTFDLWPYRKEPVSIDQRLSTELILQLRRRCHEYQLDISHFSTLSTWQIALLLQHHQAQRLGLRPEYGIDRQALNLAKKFQRPIVELEGCKQQLALLSSLPEDGKQLLHDTLMHWHSNARMLQAMIRWWLSGEAIAPSLIPQALSLSLTHHLLINRNRQWVSNLCQLPKGKYVVVVGALHLLGDESLPKLLSKLH